MKRAIVMILLGLAAKVAAQQVRVVVQVIEVPHAVLTKWTTGEKLTGEELYERAAKLASGGGAEVLDTNMLMVRSGERAFHESVAEFIYPTEYSVEGLDRVFDPPESLQLFRRAIRPLVFLDSETRDVGTTVEIEAAVSNNGTMVDLRLSYEMLDRESLMVWWKFRDRWGDASIKKPIFETKHSSSQMVLTPGKFELCNVFAPKPAAVPAVKTRQLVFVRCEVLKADADLPRK